MPRIKVLLTLISGETSLSWHLSLGNSDSWHTQICRNLNRSPDVEVSVFPRAEDITEGTFGHGLKDFLRCFDRDVWGTDEGREALEDLDFNFDDEADDGLLRATAYIRVGEAATATTHIGGAAAPTPEVPPVKGEFPSADKQPFKSPLMSSIQPSASCLWLVASCRACVCLCFWSWSWCLLSLRLD